MLAVVLLGRYPAGSDAFAMTDVSWLAAAGVPVNVRFSIALDGLSLWLFGLTALLMVVAVLVSWEAIRQQQSLYYRLLLGAGHGHVGRVCRPRHYSLLSVLRVHADAALLPDRHLGKRGAALRGDQVLPLHAWPAAC